MVAGVGRPGTAMSAEPSWSCPSWKRLQLLTCEDVDGRCQVCPQKLCRNEDVDAGRGLRNRYTTFRLLLQQQSHRAEAFRCLSTNVCHGLFVTLAESAAVKCDINLVVQDWVGVSVGFTTTILLGVVKLRSPIAKVGCPV